MPDDGIFTVCKLSMWQFRKIVSGILSIPFPSGFLVAWHYIDAQDDPSRQCGLNFTRDCFPTQGCAVIVLDNQIARINDLSLDHWERGQALR